MTLAKPATRLPPPARTLILLAALFGGLGVVLGAFAAHALRARLDPAALGWWQTANHYQAWHALALLGTGLIAVHWPSRLLSWAGGAFAAGITLFAGSLYTMALGGPRLLGMITPVGGLAMILGWALLGLAIWRVSPHDTPSERH